MNTAQPVEQTQILGAILEELKHGRMHDRLWSVDDISLYVGLSKSTIQQRVLNKNGFPRPTIIPTTEEGGSKRWYPEEVKAWAKKYR
jgi:predicted DNA-binding transcriptional regulator AlpA